jgi:hypothetical protein
MDIWTLNTEGEETGEYEVLGHNGVNVSLSGTFDTSTVTIHRQWQDGVFRPVINAAWTGAVDKLVKVPQGTIIKGIVTSVGGSTAVVAQFDSRPGAIGSRRR